MPHTYKSNNSDHSQKSFPTKLYGAFLGIFLSKRTSPAEVQNRLDSADKTILEMEKAISESEKLKQEYLEQTSLHAGMK